MRTVALTAAAAALTVVVLMFAAAPSAYACTPDYVPVITCDLSISFEFPGLFVHVPFCWVTAIDINNCGSTVVTEDYAATLLHAPLDLPPSFHF